ncbi:MAG: hypothetical protein JRN20_05810 [Nitrososphaerota archaeon]|nr:hypothetical protein [Nitrososphaerota archaeon]MDG6922522.1 hypothetical protein [Nitrososphaerota archaeon]
MISFVRESGRSAISTILVGVIVVVIILFRLAVYIRLSPSSSTTSTTSTSGSTLYTTATQTSTNIPTNAVYVDIPSNEVYEYAQFLPQLITIVVGVNTTVVWTNHDSIVHPIMFGQIIVKSS